ncbi:undecaprenyl-diphosphate phosphatase [Thioalkalivibrio sp. HK1]|uniref:undecaprenyl-diphosphate phosphatase n=1 Tax=Thioalkalivibrio sp. HK1 TaxID=1469245 RepID=UPI0004726622|nr:undecaprenyl-diphosphate phosphatase [Thioalkalivibrio sp. HK1]
MDWSQILVLAVVQGLSEFLPISSSAHLILVPKLTGWPDQGLAFDVAVHVGSLIAVLIFCRHDFLALLRAKSMHDFPSQGNGSTETGEKERLDRQQSKAMAGMQPPVEVGEDRRRWPAWWLLIIACIPVGIAGLGVDILIADALRDPIVIALATIAFGLLLLVAERYGKGDRDLGSIDLRIALLIGCAQTLALIPGTSRAGIVITAALFLGLSPKTAARFSLLLSVPTILMAGGHKAIEVATDPEAIPWIDIMAGTGIAALSALVCIHLFMRLLDRSGFTCFVIYRLALGGLLLWLFL